MRRLSVTVVALQVVATVGLAVAAVTETAASAAPAGASAFVPVAPERILDTRSTGGPVAPNGTLVVDVLGRGGLPASGVNAVVVNLTATNTQGGGYVQALPTGVAPGSSSTLNVEAAGHTVANLAVVPLGADGRIALYTQSGADLIVDVLGSFVSSGATSAGRYRALAPARVLDTRIAQGAPAGPVAPGGTVHLAVLGQGGVPASGVSAVALNVTMTQATGAGFVQAIPTGGPTAVGASSNLNAVAGQTVANLVMVPVGADGSITLHTQSGGQLLADVTGWYTDGTAPLGEDGLFVAVGPTRLLDTRSGARPADGSTTPVAPLGTFGLPASGVAALVGNVTATEAAGAGFVQALPTGQPAGGSSNLNVERAGQTLANAAVATLSPAGSFGLYTQSSTHLLFDVAGYFTGEPPAGGTGDPDPTTTTVPTTPPTTPPTTVPAQPGDLELSTPVDFLQTGARLVFSTKQNAATAFQPVVVRNAGSTTRTVTGLTFSGPDASQFQLGTGTPARFSLAPGANRTLNVRMAPSGRSTQAAMLLSASLVLATDDPSGPTRTVALAGIKMIDYEGNFEPHLSQLTQAFGFSTDVGITANRQRTTRLPAGEEIASPYWKVADAAKPVQLIPLARYSGRGPTNTSPTRWYAKGSSCGVSPSTNCHRLYEFPATPPEIPPTEEEPDGVYTGTGGENQKVLPDPTGTASAYNFNPGTSAFGLWVGFNYSDDGKNVFTLPPAEEGGPNGPTVREHVFRFYPARTPAGAVIPDTWIVAKDKFTTSNPASVNYDYQDEVFLMLNARPEIPTAAAAPGSPGHSLEFSSSVGGTLADNAGRGTGFTSVMGTHDASRVTLDTGASVLRIQSTSGTASGGSNNQKNALQVAFDGSRGPFTVSTRIVGPLPLNKASQHLGIFVGPGQDGFMKLEVEYRSVNNVNQCALVLYREGSGDGGGLRPGIRGLGSCANLTSVELNLRGDPATGAFTASYRVNGGSLTQAFTGEANTVGDPQGFFSRHSRAGIIVANQNLPSRDDEFTATFDRFALTAG